MASNFPNDSEDELSRRKLDMTNVGHTVSEGSSEINSDKENKPKKKN